MRDAKRCFTGHIVVPRSEATRPSTVIPSVARDLLLRLFPALVLLTSLALAAAGDGGWLARVPEKERVRANPLAADVDAPLAGAKLFRQHCASCHGADATGRGKKPALISARVQTARPGELFWLLTNGSMRNGMPSWSQLPAEQRWQVIAFLKTLQ